MDALARASNYGQKVFQRIVEQNYLAGLAVYFLLIAIVAWILWRVLTLLAGLFADDEGTEESPTTCWWCGQSTGGAAQSAVPEKNSVPVGTPS